MVLLMLMYLKTWTERTCSHRQPGHVGKCQRSMLYLYPCKEQVHRIHVVVLCLPKGQKFKISIDVWLFQQFPQQVVHFDGPENIEYNGNNGELQKRLS